MVNRERDDNIYYARLAEQGERYEDMIKYMKEVAMVSKAIINLTILIQHWGIVTAKNNSLKHLWSIDHIYASNLKWKMKMELLSAWKAVQLHQ